MLYNLVAYALGLVIDEAQYRVWWRRRNLPGLAAVRPSASDRRDDGVFALVGTSQLRSCLWLLALAGAILPSAAWSQGQSPPVLCYHQVVETEEGLEPGYPVILADALEGQLRHLRDHGVRTLTMDEYLEAIAQPKPPSDTVLLTFDDNYESVYTIVYPLLEKYDSHATAFVRTGSVGRANGVNPHQGWLTWDQCRELEHSGRVDIEAHGQDSHQKIDGMVGDKAQRAPYLLAKLFDPETGEAETDMSYRNRVLKELRTCKRTIDEELGKDTRAFCWPFGAANDTARFLAREAGYEVTFCLKGEGAPNGDRERHHSPESWELVLAMLQFGPPLPSVPATPMAGVPAGHEAAAPPVSLASSGAVDAGEAGAAWHSTWVGRIGVGLLAMGVSGLIWVLCVFVLFRSPGMAPRPSA